MKRMRLLIILLLTLCTGYLYLHGASAKKYVRKWQKKKWVKAKIQAQNWPKGYWDDDLNYKQKRNLIRQWKLERLMQKHPWVHNKINENPSAWNQLTVVKKIKLINRWRKQKKQVAYTRKKRTAGKDIAKFIGQTPTIHEVYAVISKNAPTANFFVVNQAGKTVNVGNFGFDRAWYESAGKTIKAIRIMADVALIKKLIAEKRLDPKHEAKAMRVFLSMMFQATDASGRPQTYTFYLNDPNPGKISTIRTSKGLAQIYPALLIMNKFQ